MLKNNSKKKREKSSSRNLFRPEREIVSEEWDSRARESKHILRIARRSCLVRGTNVRRGRFTGRRRSRADKEDMSTEFSTYIISGKHQEEMQRERGREREIRTRFRRAAGEY